MKLLTVDDLQKALGYVREFSMDGYFELSHYIDHQQGLFFLRHFRNGARIKIKVTHHEIEITRNQKIIKKEHFEAVYQYRLARGLLQGKR